MPRRDFYPSIRKALHAAWHASGNISNTTNFVLSRILFLLGQCLISVIVGGRKSFCADSSMATRSHQGYIQLTHLPLLQGEKYTLCEGCFVFFTLHHILLECPNYVDIRHYIYGASAAALTISDVLGYSYWAVDKLFMYLQEINIIYWFLVRGHSHRVYIIYSMTSDGIYITWRLFAALKTFAVNSVLYRNFP